MDFLKMHGLGNDFVIVDRRRHMIVLDDDAVHHLGDRHRGVGFDQLIFIDRPSDTGCDADIVFLNSDASVAGACGNGTRCVASLILDETGKDEIVLGSAAGHLHAKRSLNEVTVTMSAPQFGWRDVPLSYEADTLALPIGSSRYGNPVALSMGNPHAVFFVEDVEAIDIVGVGREFERHPIFADRANIGFAQILRDGDIRLRVYERGAGLTLACGSGACAALVAAVLRGLVNSSAKLHLDGGALEVTWAGAGPVFITGPVAISFRGVWPLSRQ